MKTRTTLILGMLILTTLVASAPAATALECQQLYVGLDRITVYCGQTACLDDWCRDINAWINRKLIDDGTA